MCSAEMKARCQRDEDVTAQRVCNMCGEDRLGSVLQRDKGCSLYRGTCMGAVEKRIRGIVPPNLDIVGAHDKGGLRYGKRQPNPSSLPFLSEHPAERHACLL